MVDFMIRTGIKDSLIIDTKAVVPTRREQVCWCARNNRFGPLSRHWVVVRSCACQMARICILTNFENIGCFVLLSSKVVRRKR